MAIKTNVCLTKREADWYLELADKILFEVADSDRVKVQNPELIDAYKSVYQAYSNYLTESLEKRCEKNLNADSYFLKI